MIPMIMRMIASGMARYYPASGHTNRAGVCQSSGTGRKVPKLHWLPSGSATMKSCEP